MTKYNYGLITGEISRWEDDFFVVEDNRGSKFRIYFQDSAQQADFMNIAEKGRYVCCRAKMKNGKRMLAMLGTKKAA
jgi:hypothetical protein